MAETQENTSRSLLKDYGGAVFFAVLISLFIRFFVIEAYRIPSAAMKPALEPGDTIFVAKWPFGLRWPGSAEPFRKGREPKRGEVVVLNTLEDPGRDFIKRVIGLPGDRVEIKAGHVILNGKDLTQDQRKNAVCGHEKNENVLYEVCWEPPVMPDLAPMVVPADSAFVLSDLRLQESKSAVRQKPWAMVPFKGIKAKAMWIWLSIESPSASGGSNWFSRIRFERMFKRII